MNVTEFMHESGFLYVWHFTSVQNLDSIKKHGLLPLAESKRLGIPVVTGGDETSLWLDRKLGLDEYVNLCFTRDHPMEYVRREQLGGTKYLKVSCHVLKRPNVKGSTKVSTSKDAVFLDIDELLDWQQLRVIYPRNTRSGRGPYGDVDEARRATILIPGRIPTQFIGGI